ncbi:MAG: hypothetical protein GY906_22895 [bacterium]|nr:hypothetical protein [bacterium]
MTWRAWAGILRSMRVSHIEIPAWGDLPTIVTVWKMRGLAREGSWHPHTRAVATSIVRPGGGRDGTVQAQLVREWLAEHLHFQRDPQGTELLHGVPLQLATIAKVGTADYDCDDAAILAAALGKAVGLKARFQVVGFGSPRAPFRHVFTELRSPQGGPWVEQDVTRSAQQLPTTASRTWTVEV